MYKIIRYYFTGTKRIVRRGLTLEQAQEHCDNHFTHGLSNPRRPGAGQCDNRKCSMYGRIVHNEHCPKCGIFPHHDWFDGYDVDC